MNLKTRERVMRVLLSSFLKSDLTATELQELSYELADSPQFLADFNRMLNDVVHRLLEGRSSKFATIDDEMTNPVDTAYNSIKRRRLSKNQVLDIMSACSPNARRSILSTGPNPPLRRLLDNFFRNITSTEMEKFLQLISGVTPDDPYLRGIIGRKLR